MAISHPSNTARERDPRLDFFRGVGMFIIFIAHVPGNSWTLWIPARFGFSDATEIFVFCSGMASAIAFGSIFTARGWWVGTARTLYRAWQIYWVHIGVFVLLSASLAALDAYGVFGQRYIANLNLERFYADPKANLFALMTLTYVPNYFDILPMYFVILLMLPLVVAFRKAGFWFAAMFVVGIWMAAQLDILRLPAEPWSNREWFFNPFGWQLIFFTGFAFMSGWIKPPPVNVLLIALAATFVLATIPFAYFEIIRAFAFFKSASEFLSPFTAKTDFGVLRYVHFLALAYLAWVAAGAKGARLKPAGVLRHAVGVVHKVGQQALATFIAGLVAAQFLTIFYVIVGKSQLVIAGVNFAGFAILIVVAYITGWFKRERSAKTRALSH